MCTFALLVSMKKNQFFLSKIRLHLFNVQHFLRSTVLIIYFLIVTITNVCLIYYVGRRLISIFTKVFCGRGEGAGCMVLRGSTVNNVNTSAGMSINSSVNLT